MEFKTLSGCLIKMDINPARWPHRTADQCKSNIQFEVGQEVKKLFPRHTILEEFAIPSERLFLDFYLPSEKLAVEVQGAQHDTYNKFFHKSRADFIAAQARDQRKREWCKLNNIGLLAVREVADVRDGILRILRGEA